jgi:hypothetical protein
VKRATNTAKTTMPFVAFDIFLFSPMSVICFFGVCFQPQGGDGVDFRSRQV